MMEFRDLVVDEAVTALRLARRYRGKFARDEFEFARILLDDLEAGETED